jgi:alkanesulfonate monooxygenase SsuD/methylene tetrahydromethanopterin reductase-like flavin-dependent oxidoreductase (luciferase family)
MALRIGIGPPTFHGNLVDGPALLDWARQADEAGFHALAVHDKPNSDTWEPLSVLAAFAAVTRRVRLVTTAVLLPTRDEALVAKQALVVDRLSDGRLELGVSVGVRPDDFELFGRPLEGRGRRFEAQLARILELWTGAEATRETGAAMGPAPVQRPHPTLLVGGYAEAAVGRAARFGDGYVFGAPGPAAMAARIPVLREAAAAAGKTTFPIEGLAYVLPTEDPTEIAEGERLLRRYYGTLHKPFDEMVMTGRGDRLVDAVRRFADAGLDVLHLLPVATASSAIDRLAEDVLPAFHGSGG